MRSLIAGAVRPAALSCLLPFTSAGDGEGLPSAAWISEERLSGGLAPAPDMISSEGKTMAPGGRADQSRASNLTRLTQAQADETVRKHEMLYLGKVGGARAVFAFCDLTGLTLAGRNLADADFTGAVLAECNLSDSKLDRAIFFCSDLRRTRMTKASLRRADLRGACLRGANLLGADLFESDLREGSIAEKDAKGNLRYLNHELKPSELQAVVLANANLERAKLTGVIAIQADFTDAVMRDCKLVRANLRQCKMTGANLEGADLSGADLKGADLRDAVLVGAKMAMTVTDGANMDNVLTDKPAGCPLVSLERPIEELLALHQRWYETGGAEGQPLVLEEVDLRPLKSLAHANLTAFRAKGSNLYGMDLNGIQLQGAQLDGTDLRTAKLSGADLRGINLKKAKLNNADLRDCNLGPLLIGPNRLFPAQLDGAILRFADFRGADLFRTSFVGADLAYANLVGARLRGTDFSQAFLDATQFAQGAIREAVAQGCLGLQAGPATAAG